MLRNDKQLTLREVSPYISYGHLSDVERGVKSVSPELLEIIAKGLMISVPELLREVSYYIETNGYKEINRIISQNVVLV